VFGSMMGIFMNQGQVCCAGSRIFVQDSMYDQFTDSLTQMAGGLTLGDPFDPNTRMGPLVSREQHERVLGYLKIGKDEGAKTKIGGERGPQERGYFVKPTVLTDVKNNMRIAREEIFGPVLSVFKWSDPAKMLEQVNSVEYGLTASIWTNDLSTAHRTAASVQAGFVWINEVSKHFLGAPFGGYKQSGIGREECFEEMVAYTQEKNIHVRLRPAKT